MEESMLTGFLPEWLKIGSSILLAGLIINALYNKYLSHIFRKKTLEAEIKIHPTMKNMEIIVKGMTCNHCKATVENNVRALEGIEQAEANLSTEKVTISGENIDLEKVKEKVESLGYKFEGLAG